MTSLDPARRDARLGVRLPEANKRLIKQAAAVCGQSVSDFEVSSLVLLSREIIDEANVTRLTARDRDHFLALIADDAQPNDALRSAAQRFKGARG